MLKLNRFYLFQDDDESEYKCTVWNQAIDKAQTMEASTKINVNCKYFFIIIHNILYINVFI